MRLLTTISIISLGLAVAACGDSTSGSGGGGGAGGGSPAAGGGDTVGSGGSPGTGGDIGTGGNGTGGEAPCDEGQTLCVPDDTCVPAEFVCDGEDDCSDGSDEPATCPGPVACTDQEYECPGNGACIPIDFLCDGDDDCGQAEDEDPTFCALGCPEGYAECSDGLCIDEAWVCDGENDCAAGEDEDADICGGGICDSGITNTDPDATFCLAVECCAEFEFCSDNGADVQGCLDCLTEGGGEYCDDAIQCSIDYCGL